MPKLTDPGEMDTIREIYFVPAFMPANAEIDPEELNDRMERRHTVNQAR